MKRKRYSTTRLYLYLLIVNLLLIFFLFFSSDLHILGEDLGPGRLFLMIALVFFACFSQFMFFIESESHNRTVSDMEERLTDSFKYIGKINLLVDEFKSIFVPKKDFPSTKIEFKKIIKDYTERIMAISREDWAAIRIIDMEGLNTAAEYCSRSSSGFKPTFTNNDIVKNSCEFHVVSTKSNNHRLKAYCLLPKEVKEKEIAFFITSIIGQLELMVAVMHHGGSTYHHNAKKRTS